VKSSKIEAPSPLLHSGDVLGFDPAHNFEIFEGPNFEKTVFWKIGHVPSFTISSINNTNTANHISNAPNTFLNIGQLTMKV
jgi:hypothetical protein